MSAAQQNRGASGRLDFLIGLIAVIGALLAILWLIPSQIDASGQSGQLSPRFFPTLSAAIVGLFGLALAVKNHRYALIRVPNAGPRLLLETLAWGIWASLTLLILAKLGFIVAWALSCFAAMLLAGQRRRLIWCAIVAILLPVAIQQLAWHAFYIQLP
jgi:hypothetical protein